MQSATGYSSDFMGLITAKLQGEVQECQEWLSKHPTALSMDKEGCDNFNEACHVRYNRDTMPVRIQDAQEALRRIENGTFGVCIGFNGKGCGKIIPEEKLLACVTAKRCASCQQIHERISGRRYY